MGVPRICFKPACGMGTSNIPLHFMILHAHLWCAQLPQGSVAPSHHHCCSGHCVVSFICVCVCVLFGFCCHCSHVQCFHRHCCSGCWWRCLECRCCSRHWRHCFHDHCFSYHCRSQPEFLPRTAAWERRQRVPAARKCQRSASPATLHALLWLDLHRIHELLEVLWQSRFFIFEMRS